jgi:alkanesulfonate monooxygenase SsuD/methylene tetrahydromethanopterin reductase-like flavin-dependent oxidoreductase (luciferase family)
LFFELGLPKPWGPDSEHDLFVDVLDQIEAADKAGFSAVWFSEHHFLEEYSTSSAPEIVLAAAASRTKNIRLGHGVAQIPPPISHPAKIAARVATLDQISGGRVEFGTGEASSVAELGGFGVDPVDKRSMWREALTVTTRCMAESPFTGYKGEHIDMPQRNVVPKPRQSPHPPVWVACTRHSTAIMAAESGIGALSFSLSGTKDLASKVSEYYQVFEDRAVPLTPGMNPNFLSLVGDLPLMVAKTDEEAIRRLDINGGFFSFALGRHYVNGDYVPGRTDFWSEYVQHVAEDPTRVYGPGRGPVGSPDTVKAWLRQFEESGVDEIMFYTAVKSHEETMESIELMGKYVLPEFIEREEATARAKEIRVRPLLDKAEARRVDDRPEMDENLRIGGTPKSAKSDYVANEVIENQNEMDAAIAKAATEASFTGRQGSEHQA